MKIKKLAIVIILTAVCAGGVYGYLFFNKSSDAENTTSIYNPASLFGEPATSTSQTPEDWREYRNAIRGFSLHHPPVLSVKEYNEEDGAYTVVFEDPAGQQGFQIFFAPYALDYITRARVLKDVPGGKFTEPVEIVIAGGNRALTFLSDGPAGQMREVWFLRDGYLYEATTYADLDAWLADIMRTWKF